MEELPFGDRLAAPTYMIAVQIKRAFASGARLDGPNGRSASPFKRQKMLHRRRETL
jgi:hypothetical protein